MFERTRPHVPPAAEMQDSNPPPTVGLIFPAQLVAGPENALGFVAEVKPTPYWRLFGEWLFGYRMFSVIRISTSLTLEMFARVFMVIWIAVNLKQHMKISFHWVDEDLLGAIARDSLLLLCFLSILWTFLFDSHRLHKLWKRYFYVSDKLEFEPYMLDRTLDIVDQWLASFLTRLPAVMETMVEILPLIIYSLWETVGNLICPLLEVFSPNFDTYSLIGLCIFVILYGFKFYFTSIERENRDMEEKQKIFMDKPSKEEIIIDTSKERVEERKRGKKFQQKQTWREKKLDIAIKKGIAQVVAEKHQSVPVEKPPKTAPPAKTKEKPLQYKRPFAFDEVVHSGKSKGTKSQTDVIVDHMPNLFRCSPQWASLVGWDIVMSSDADDDTVPSGVKEMYPRILDAKYWPVKQEHEGMIVNDGLTSLIVRIPEVAEPVGKFYHLRGDKRITTHLLFSHKLNVDLLNLADRGQVDIFETIGANGVLVFNGPGPDDRAWVPKRVLDDLSVYLSSDDVKWMNASFAQIGYSWGLTPNQTQALRVFVLHEHKLSRESEYREESSSMNILYALTAWSLALFGALFISASWWPIDLGWSLLLVYPLLLNLIGNLTGRMNGPNHRRNFNYRGLLIAATTEELLKRAGGFWAVLSLSLFEAKLYSDTPFNMMIRFLIHLSWSWMPLWISIPLHASANYLIYRNSPRMLRSIFDRRVSTFPIINRLRKVELKFNQDFLPKRMFAHIRRIVDFQGRGQLALKTVLSLSSNWFSREYGFWYESEELLLSGYIQPVMDIAKKYFILTVNQLLRRPAFNQMISIVCLPATLYWTVKPTSIKNILAVIFKRLADKLEYCVSTTHHRIELFDSWFWSYVEQTYPFVTYDVLDGRIPVHRVVAENRESPYPTVRFAIDTIRLLYDLYCEHLIGQKLRDAISLRDAILRFVELFGFGKRAFDELKRLGYLKVMLMCKADELTYESKKGRQIFVFKTFMTHLIGFMFYNATKMFKHNLATDLLGRLYRSNPYTYSMRDELFSNEYPLRIIPQLNFVLEATPVKLSYLFTHLVIFSYKIKERTNSVLDSMSILKQWKDLRMFMFDISNADRSTNANWMKFATQVLQVFGGKNELLRLIMNYMTHEIHASTRFGMKMVIKEMLCTGAPWTSFGNSIIILAQAISTLMDIGVWDEYWTLLQTGDDSIGVSIHMYDDSLDWVSKFSDELLRIGVKCECQVNNLAQVDYIGCKMVPALYNDVVMYVPIPFRFLKQGCFHTFDIRGRTGVVRSVFDYWCRITRCDPLAYAWSTFCLKSVPQYMDEPQIDTKVTLQMLGKTNPGFDWLSDEVMEFYDQLKPLPEAYDFCLERYGGTMDELLDCIDFLKQGPPVMQASIVDHPYLRRVINREFPM